MGSLYYALSKEDYFCFLDVDDAYNITFLEEVLRFLTENELDIVMCGSVFMNSDIWISYGCTAKRSAVIGITK